MSLECGLSALHERGVARSIASSNYEIKILCRHTRKINFLAAPALWARGKSMVNIGSVN